MRVVATSDFHGHLPDPDEIPKCDVLLIAGDVTPVWNHNQEFQAAWLAQEFGDWLDEIELTVAEHIVWIGGNHDMVLHKALGQTLVDPKSLGGIYLKNETVEVAGLKIYGSPYSPKFGSWAFMKPDSMLAEMWREIPQDVNVIMTHGPAHGVNDRTRDGEFAGSATLRNQLTYGKWPNLQLFVCGHIHEGYGQEMLREHVEANVSYVDSQYKPGNPPMVFDL